MEGNPLHETVHTSFGTVCAVGVVVKKQNPYQNIIFLVLFAVQHKSQGLFTYGRRMLLQYIYEEPSEAEEHSAASGKASEVPPNLLLESAVSGRQLCVYNATKGSMVFVYFLSAKK
jgi:hypothetical protein